MPLGGPKQRTLLTVLVMRAGEVVSADALIDALWGDEPPATARTALQVRISKLRKLLAGDPSAKLETRGPGYVLHVDPEQVDLHRFDRHVERGRAALAGGEYERAREELQAALELWRGEPLEGIDVPNLAGELADLRERRTAALEARLEADLALGRHLEAIPEIDRLRAEDPMNERLAATAAIALYRAGQQADALEVLAKLRRALSEELGIAPGAAIEELERRILTHDPALDLVVEGETATVREGRKTVTALVCRTTPAPDEGRHDPEAQRGALGSLASEVRGAIEASGGTVHEALGGKVTAVFGMPRAHEDDATRAVRVAAELRELLRTRTEEGAAVSLRIGIATGEVLVEDRGREQVLLSGEPLELADRLSGAARAGEVLLDQATFRLARHAAGAEPAEILLLGDDAPAMAAFRLIGVPTGVGRRLSSPLVGRREELALLRRAFDRVVRERTCSLVTILGPAGVGKSKLASEFASMVGDEARVLVGRCLSYGRDITFWPVAEIVRQAAGIGPDEPPTEVRARVAEVVSAEDDADFIEEQVAAVLGVADVTPVPDEIFWAIRKVLEAEARRRPLVVVFDDLHWAEATLLDLIEHIVASWRDAPVLLVCLARPELVEGRSGWGSGRLDATNLTLSPLSREESAQLIANLLGRAALAAEAEERILAAAEGNPLFLEELLSMLIDEGILRWHEGRWISVRDLSEVPIPLTVQALLGARLDRLSQVERRVLELGSLVGKEFTEDDLRAFDLGDEDVPAALGALERKDLIVLERVSREAGRTFRFRHVLIRDVVYQGMSKEARARDHESYGSFLELRAGERIAELEEIVGYHLEAAHRYREELGLADDAPVPLGTRAAERLTSAGRRAFSRRDMPAAASLLRRALGLLADDHVLRPEVSWLLGVALVEVGRLAEAESILAEGVEIADRLADLRFGWRMRMEQADLRSWLHPEAHDPRELERVTEAAIADLERVGDLGGVARACRLMGDAMLARGRHVDAMELYERGQRYALEAGDEREATERGSFGVAHGPVPAERCIGFIRGNLDRARRPDPDGLAALGLVLAMTGRLDEAWAVFEDALSRSRDLGAEWKTASINMYRGAALLIAGDPIAAESALRPSVESLQRMGERSNMSTGVAILGEALYRQGKYDEAMLATLVSQEATAEDDLASQMAWRGVRAKVLAVRGELREAERLAREGVAIADGTGFVSMAGDAHMDLAAVLEAAGRTREAAAEIEIAHGLYERKGNVVSAGAAAARLEELRETLDERTGGAA